jgi:hypothetical protein
LYEKLLTSTIIYTSEENKKLRASRVILGSGEDANEPTNTKRDMATKY